MFNNRNRTIIVVIFCSLLFIYLFYTLFKLQISQHENYKNIRNVQNQFDSQVNKRGTIYGTRKDGELVSLAQDDVWYKLVIAPKNIDLSYEERLYSLLNDITPIDKDTFLAKCANKKDSYEVIKVINKSEAEQVEKLSLQGVFTYKDFKRQYPLKEIGSRIIGFVGGGDSGYVGRYGLEKYYEDDLNSKESINTTFFSKIFSDDSTDHSQEYSKNIVTSLEPNVMKFLNKTLMDMKNDWEADEVSAIIMDPQTGEILAMDTVPGFDPNDYKNADIKNFGNPSVQGVYELGSIMKPITMSGGIEAGLVTPETYYRDYGFVKIDNYTIKNFDEKVRGDQTMQDVISNSLNTGAVFVEKLLGKEKFKQNFIKFGLEDQTGIDFPGEVINKTDNLDTNTEVNFATAAFGQGVAITPISMLSSLSVIANDGKSMCPHFLESKVLYDGSKINYECENEQKEVISTTTARTMKGMLVELIDTGLAHGRYKDKNYKIAAKTGTAQLPSPDGKYYKDKFVHSYFTFFPAENPKFAVLIYQVNPKKGQLASLTLSPPATKIKDFLLTYYNIPPDRQ